MAEPWILPHVAEFEPLNGEYMALDVYGRGHFSDVASEAEALAIDASCNNPPEPKDAIPF